MILTEYLDGFSLILAAEKIFGEYFVIDLTVIDIFVCFFV